MLRRIFLLGEVMWVKNIVSENTCMKILNKRIIFKTSKKMGEKINMGAAVIDRRTIYIYSIPVRI